MQNILNKLAKNKKVDVKLSAVSEIESKLEWWEERYSLASYYAYERFSELTDMFEEMQQKFYEVDELAINTGVAYLDDDAKEILSEVDALESSLADLGLNLDEVEFDTPNGTLTLSELKSELQNSIDVHANMLNEYREFVRYVGFLNEHM
jgi:hypothetical protein